MKRILALVLFVSIVPVFAYADQGGFTNSGGSLSGGSTVANPAGTLTIGGGTLTFVSSDGTTIVDGTFSTSSTVESCSGGGKGGHITCSFTFTGKFSGTATLNGVTEAINGTTYQLYGSNGVVITGSTGYNSAYTPFYFSNTGQILRADDLNGTNMISYGTQGSGTGQFYGALGIAVDSTGRIYVADTYNDRIVRIDDMNGTNWTSFGSYGSDVGQFMDPQGISVDAAGRIYVMDTGNSRLIRMDDLNGTNWTTFSSNGSGAGQLSTFVAAPAFDASGRLYIADTGNNRVVRMDDMTGANWTTLSQSPVIGIYIYSLGSPIGVALDAAGRIYIANQNQPSVVRVDDMTGTNWTSIGLGTNATPHSIAADANGMVLVGGGGAQIVDNMAGVLMSGSGLTQFYGPYYVFGATPAPISSPPPSAIGFSPTTLDFSQNVGTVSGSQAITVTNFGGNSLNGLTFSAGGAFAQTNTCPAVLTAGSICTVSVAFTPPAAGFVTGTLTVSDDSANLGPAQALTLTGTGTTPAATVTPSTLSLSAVAGTTSTAKTITVQSSGTGPLQVTSIATTAPFNETDNCAGTNIAPGGSCTIQVTFSPLSVGSVSGTVTITGNAGTQNVTLSGNGSSPVSLSSTSVSFGSMAVGETSAAKTVTITNRLSFALNFSSIGMTAGTSFAIASNTCATGIAAGASCSVSVTFTPAALGSAAGVLTFVDNAVTSPQNVNLSGSGVAPVTLSSTSLSFSTVVAGTTSSAKTVTLTNNQNIALNFTGVALTGPFTVSSNTCTGTLAAGGKCTVGVTFSPAATGSFTGILSFADDASNAPQTVALSGSGSAPLTFSSSSLNFGYVTVGTTSSVKTITATNHLNVALSLSSVATSGVPFSIVNNTCGSTIAAGGSCTIGVTFSPAAAGSASGALTFTDNAAGSPQVVTLSGTGR